MKGAVEFALDDRLKIVYNPREAKKGAGVADQAKGGASLLARRILSY